MSFKRYLKEAGKTGVSNSGSSDVEDFAGSSTDDTANILEHPKIIIKGPGKYTFQGLDDKAKASWLTNHDPAMLDHMGKLPSSYGIGDVPKNLEVTGDSDFAKKVISGDVKDAYNNIMSRVNIGDLTDREFEKLRILAAKVSHGTMGEDEAFKTIGKFTKVYDSAADAHNAAQNTHDVAGSTADVHGAATDAHGATSGVKDAADLADTANHLGGILAGVGGALATKAAIQTVLHMMGDKHTLRDLEGIKDPRKSAIRHKGAFADVRDYIHKTWRLKKDETPEEFKYRMLDYYNKFEKAQKASKTEKSKDVEKIQQKIIEYTAKITKENPKTIEKEFKRTKGKHTIEGLGDLRKLKDKNRILKAAKLLIQAHEKYGEEKTKKLLNLGKASIKARK
jgi:hypothetical protein